LPPTRILSKCQWCGNAGYRTWKQPWNYPLSEVQFCECSYGEAALQFWEAKAKAAKQDKLRSLFAGAGVPAHYRDLTLETLRQRIQGEPEKLEALATVEEFIEKGFATDKRTGRYKFSLLISGSFGIGKTGMLTPVLQNYLERSKVGLWIEAKEFVKEVQAGYSNGDSEAKLDAAKRADIILLDDLGDKARTDNQGNLMTETVDRIEILYRLINHRHNHELPMLITTNLTGVELAHQIGERVFNRIIESCAWVKMAGRNLRME
jgi:DNA replication protein DnaC